MTKFCGAVEKSASFFIARKKSFCYTFGYEIDRNFFTKFSQLFRIEVGLGRRNKYFFGKKRARENEYFGVGAIYVTSSFTRRKAKRTYEVGK